MYTKIAKRIFLIAVFSLLAGLSSCRHTPEDVVSRLDRAEQLMESRPDSALMIITDIDTAEIHGCPDRARYALLKSIALDKNYIDTTTFSILQPAIDYYLHHGTSDERLKTRYYQGRIYMNRGDDDAALTSFLQASEDTARCTDRRALARLLIAQGHMYYKEGKYPEYTDCNLQASEIYRDTRDSINLYACLSRALIGSNINADTVQVNTLLEKCIGGLNEYGNTIENLPVAVISVSNRYISETEFNNLLDKMQDRVEISPGIATELAYAYSHYGNMDRALQYINEGDKSDSLHYYAIRSEILEKSNDSKGALDAYRNYLTAEENALQELINNNLLFTRRKYLLDLKNLEAESAKRRVIYLTAGIISLLALICITIIAWLRYTKMRLKNTEINLVNSRLKLENSELNLQIANTENEKLNLQNTLLVERLDVEKYHLVELLQENKDLSSRLKNIITTRLKLINSLLAKEISGNEKYAKPLNDILSQVHNEKSTFLKHIRENIEMSNPRFIKYLKERALTEFEIDYLCLYCIGLKGKDIGLYLGAANHYNYSHEIRKKLGITSDKNYLYSHIVRLMDSL